MKTVIVLGPGATFSLDAPNSIETVVRTLARESADRGELLIVCDAGAADRGELPTLAVDPAGGAARRTGRVIEALKRHGPQFLELHQHGPTSARIARAFPRLPTILYRHNAAAAPGNAFDRLRHEHRFAAFDAHVFVSDFLRQDFAETFPRFAARGHTVPNPIDMALWRPEAGAAREPMIAYAGRATPEKGLDLLCDALAAVLDRHADWRAELLLRDFDAHAAWSKPQLAKLDRFGARARIAFEQPWAAVRDTLRRASIVAVPSVFQDPFPLSVLEAHAAGAAVVSSGRGGLRQASGEHAVYVDPIDADTLARAFDGLIEEPARRLALAAGGQAHVAAEHSPARRAAQLDALRRRLVDDKRRV